MRRLLLTGAWLGAALLATACQEPTTAPAHAPAGGRLQSARTDAPSVDREAALAGAHIRVLDRFSPALARRAIDPNDYVCQSSTPVVDWYLAQVINVIQKEPGTFDLLYNLAADLVPFVDGILFTTTASPQSFGYTGGYTQVLTKTERDVKRFWDIPSADIQVVAAHGTMLLDEPRTARTYEAGFGVPQPLAAFFASLVDQAVATSTTLDRGNHPFFSFNAIAAWADDGSFPDKIVMGDGILEGYAAVGLGDVAPQAIFAHEFAHHIQNRRNYFADPYATAGDPPEQTRYTELMADAYAAYYLTHARGAAMNRKRVEQFFEVFFQIGDCAFDNPGHHGTPNQRMKAASFGFDVADEARKQGQILTSQQFHDRFVAVYPALITPDAS